MKLADIKITFLRVAKIAKIYAYVSLYVSYVSLVLGLKTLKTSLSKDFHIHAHYEDKNFLTSVITGFRKICEIK